jgi:uncharacterized protein (DUF1684 family)
VKKLFLLALFFCGLSLALTWQEDLESWKDSRVKSLTKPHGWLSLIGMEWLHNGNNTIGSATDNDIVLPHGPEYIGNYYLEGETIKFTVDDSSLALLTINDKAAEKSFKVMMDTQENTSVFKIDSFLFYVIERGKPALRIKDSQAKSLADFKGLDYFDVTEKFRLDAEFVAYTPEKDVEIINVLGLLTKDQSPGYIKFKIDDKYYQLDTLDAGDEYYLIFADRTSGRSSYGPGRFLYVPKAKVDGFIKLDFNKAYNPPCAFTDYSTCPLPPPQNRIPVFIEAGEKKYR